MREVSFGDSVLQEMDHCISEAFAGTLEHFISYMSNSDTDSHFVPTLGTELIHRIFPESSSAEKNIQAVTGDRDLYCFTAASNAWITKNINLI